MMYNEHVLKTAAAIAMQFGHDNVAGYQHVFESWESLVDGIVETAKCVERLREQKGLQWPEVDWYLTVDGTADAFRRALEQASEGESLNYLNIAVRGWIWANSGVENHA